MFISQIDCDRHVLVQSPQEVIQHLTSPKLTSKCPNITYLIDEESCDSTPLFGGGFGDVYRGSLKNETRVALKCIRLLPQRTSRVHQVSH